MVKNIKVNTIRKTFSSKWLINLRKTQYIRSLKTPVVAVGRSIVFSLVCCFSAQSMVMVVLSDAGRSLVASCTGLVCSCAVRFQV